MGSSILSLVCRCSQSCILVQTPVDTGAVLLLAALLLIVPIVLPIVAIVRTRKIRTLELRVAGLEAALRRLIGERTAAAPPPPEAVPPTPAVPGEPPKPAQSPTPVSEIAEPAQPAPDLAGVLGIAAPAQSAPAPRLFPESPRPRNISNRSSAANGWDGWPFC